MITDEQLEMILNSAESESDNGGEESEIWRP
jgi:hypothetical protein